MQYIVNFSGQMAAGKDEAVNILLTRLDDSWRKVAFAGALKDVLCRYFGVTLDFIEAWKRKNEIPEGFLVTIRESLQRIGDGFRQIQPNIWIDAVFRLNPDCNLCLTDGRYDSEIEAVAARSGINVLIWRPGYENDSDHPSEAQVKVHLDKVCGKYKDGLLDDPDVPFDMFLINDGTLEDLAEKIDTILVPYIYGRLYDKNKYNFEDNSRG